MLFRDSSEESIRESLRRAKKEKRLGMRDTFDAAIDYLEDRMYDDTRQKLYETFEESMKIQGRNQEIQPVMVPLLQRYVHEHATLYSKPPRRTLVSKDSREPNDELTKAYNDAMDEAGLNESLHYIEQIRVLLKSCGIWCQKKRNRLRFVPTMPQYLYPMLGSATEENLHIDPTDQHDYDGFAVELFADAEDVFSSSQRRFAVVGKEATVWYQGGDVDEFNNEIGRWENPYRWPVMDESGNIADRPLNTLVITHLQKSSELLPDHDCIILEANRNANVYLSSVFDTMRFQGWSVPWVAGMDADKMAQMPHGVRFPRILNAGESMGYASAGISFGDLVGSIMDFIRLTAVMLRDSPNDYNISETARAASGFAKMIDALPKMQARSERKERARRSEEEDLYPVIASILETIDPKFRALRDHYLVVEYQDIEFPETVGERNQREEHDIKYGFKTRAQILADRTGMSEEEAQSRVEENLAQISSVEEGSDEEQENSQADDTESDKDHVGQKAPDPAEVKAIQEIVVAAGEGKIDRTAAIALLKLTYGLDDAQANALVPEREEQPAPEQPVPAQQQEEPESQRPDIRALIRGRR